MRTRLNSVMLLRLVLQHAPSDSFQMAEGSMPLLETHEVVRLAAFDMFPATGHVEMAAYLRKRATPTKQEQDPQNRQDQQSGQWGKRNSTYYKDCGCGALMVMAGVYVGLYMWTAGSTRKLK